jgi:hypothetical protein
MANYMDSPAKQDNDGITYIFGSYDKEEKWNFSPFYFRLINTERNKISGQFISSNWFSKVYTQETPQHYMVIGINTPFDFKNIKNIINDSLPSQLLYHKITEKEFDAGVVFKDHYIITAGNNDKILREDTFKVSKHKSITINGENGLSKLIITARRLENDRLYMTLPDFTMNFDN